MELENRRWPNRLAAVAAPDMYNAGGLVSSAARPDIPIFGNS